MLDIPPFSLIRFPFDFRDGKGPVRKRFAILAHQGPAAICVKTTSKTNPFKSSPERLDGVALYKVGECSHFECETVIDPDNCFAIPHSQLESYKSKGTLEILGIVPDLRARLIKAIKLSSELTQQRRKNLLKLLGHDSM